MILTIFLSVIGTLCLEFIGLGIFVASQRKKVLSSICKPSFPEAKEISPVYGWVWLYADTHKLYFRDKEVEVCETKEQAEFRRRCFGMLAGCIKIMPCKIQVLEEIK